MYVLILYVYIYILNVFYLIRFLAKLEDLFNQTLSESTSANNLSMCKATLLVFRHCCLEIGLWSEYSRWYSSYKPNVDTAKAFYSLLTELLPYDLPAAIAAHTNIVITIEHNVQFAVLN